MRRVVSLLLAGVIWPQVVQAQTATPTPLPPGLAELLRPQPPGSTLGPQRGARPPGLPVYTAWEEDRITLVWPAPGPGQRGTLEVGGRQVAAGQGSASLPLLAAGMTEWRLHLADGTSFAGQVRRLGEAELQALDAALDRAEAKGRGDPAITAALQLEVYVAHELYVSALRYLARRPALAGAEPFAALARGIEQRMMLPPTPAPQSAPPRPTSASGPQ